MQYASDDSHQSNTALFTIRSWAILLMEQYRPNFNDKKNNVKFFHYPFNSINIYLGREMLNPGS